jgi:FKBP-type peptidyl-prolyl cis-trans isomerase
VRVSKKLSAKNAHLPAGIVKAGVASKAFSQVKQSFFVTGESYPDLTPKIEILSTVGDAVGEPVKEGKSYTFKYKGSLESTPDVPFDEGSIKFHVGAGEVIRGFDMGVKGLCLGQTRVVKIPPSLGYGKRGSGKEVPPDSTLIFEFSLAPPKQ